MIEKFPKLLVTAYTCKAKTVIREMEDLLYIYDPSARIVESKFKDVILVYTEIDAVELLKLIRRRTPTGMARAVKIDACVDTDPDKIALKVIELFERCKGSRFYVDCRRRGRRIKSSWELEKYVGAKIVSNNLGRVSFRDPECIIRLEVVDEVTLISIIGKYGDEVENRNFR
jgi:tRNA(Ser,Leu) C12 N-acetylase TAN1